MRKKFVGLEFPKKNLLQKMTLRKLFPPPPSKKKLSSNEKNVIQPFVLKRPQDWSLKLLTLNHEERGKVKVNFDQKSIHSKCAKYCIAGRNSSLKSNDVGPGIRLGDHL